jgi:membrane protein YdbS with pleckstrin-like domain
MNCPNCGAQLAPGVRFCGACGARVDANTSADARNDDELTRLSRDDEATRVAHDADATRVAARSPFDGSDAVPARVERLGTAQESPSVARMREPQGVSRQPVSQVPSRNAAIDTDAERTIFAVRPTLLFVGLGYALAAVAAVGLTILLAKFNLLSEFYSVLVSLPLLLIPAYYHLRRNTIKYTLTDAKIEIDQGLIARRTRNIPLRTIQDVTVSATIPQRILGFGDLIIENASEVGGTTVMHNIPAPRRRADELLRELRRWN